MARAFQCFLTGACASLLSRPLPLVSLPMPPMLQDLPGVFSAREFVWWYNGHPAYRDLPIDLSRTRSVAIAGLGNVAGELLALWIRWKRGLPQRRCTAAAGCCAAIACCGRHPQLTQHSAAHCACSALLPVLPCLPHCC